MTEDQLAAHARLIATLPVRRVGDQSDPENWPERDRELSPDERPYLPANRAAA